MGYCIELTNSKDGNHLAFRADMSMRKAWKICQYINRYSNGTVKAEIVKRRNEKNGFENK